MATQHPDNACAPYWEQDGDGFISTREETVECASAFCDLGCQEFLWDWEGKYVDEAIVDRLFHEYYNYFSKRQLGRDIFLTFRIPNTHHEKGYSLARAFMGILTAEAHARDLKFHTPPLFEVILPMTDSAQSIINIQQTFTKLAIFKRKLFEDDTAFDYLRILPLFEGVGHLINCGTILDKYVMLHQKQYRKKPEYMRTHIARSDPALNSGLVSAVVAGKAALSEMYCFGKRHDIPVFPAIGAGALPFRGSLSAERVEQFMSEYPGMKTVYIQSAFRYDFPIKTVKAAIKTLNKNLQQSEPRLFNKSELREIKTIVSLFSGPYQKSIEPLANTIEKLSRQFPDRRERKLHIGLFGYSRSIGKKRLPRAIPFTGILYSLGIPPELIGTGRGLSSLAKRGIDLEKYYTTFRQDIAWAGKFFNRENLALLAKRGNAWAQIEKDVELIEKLLKLELGPKTSEDMLHRNSASNALHLFKSGKPIAHEMVISGKIRKSLG